MHTVLPFKKAVFAIRDLQSFKLKMLHWANQRSIFLFLDSNEYKLPHNRFDLLVGVGEQCRFTDESADVFERLNVFHEQHSSWLFGHLAYDLKNILEPRLYSAHVSQHQFPLIQFVVPEVVLGITEGSDELFIESATQLPEVIFNEIHNFQPEIADLPAVNFQRHISKKHYLQTISDLREHIRNGDCYEINFCVESFANGVELDAITAFQRLNEISRAPFAACYRVDDQYLMCASPERYLQKNDAKIISQPIKGTARRDVDPTKDEQLKTELYNSEKERAENVMIVDLVRNDLARSCEVGSVSVEELFGIYTFPQVHQMTSTVTGTMKNSSSFTDALKNSFPMGSMTGAPKVKVMELIERYEQSRRELFSGSVGYITPDGDFDFNVVIRSLFYNQSSQYLSYQTGGAITWDSHAECEWDEMRLKASAMEKLFRPA